MSTPSPAAVLEAVNLSKTYSGRPAVDNVSFAIHAGEVLGYLGPNGSGKSTTVKMLTGLLSPSSGQILFRGARISHDLVGYKRRLGYVPEEANLYSFLSGWEYLDLVGTLRGMDRKLLAHKSAVLLEGLSLFPHRHTPISAYSKGMRQRILLIAALMHDPEIVILDEPLSGLDVISALIIRKVIGLLAAQGKAIVFCSPVLEVVEKVCSHLLILRRGVVVAHGSIEEIRSGTLMPALEDTFLHLTEQVDADKVAGSILAAINS
ncbi:MAG TPA: ABC transporter ATP-binding protein [Bryobacteraceae bacterium]|nr:ABC transporter ATP-binding protein [Bryobacteraceae bacterium]